MVPDDEAHITVARLNSFPGWLDNVVAFVDISKSPGRGWLVPIITPLSLGVFPQCYAAKLKNDLGKFRCQILCSDLRLTLPRRQYFAYSWRGTSPFGHLA